MYPPIVEWALLMKERGGARVYGRPLHTLVSPAIQLLSHLSIPDETFLCCKMKAKVDYIGMLQDGESPVHPEYQVFPECIKCL